MTELISAIVLIISLIGMGMIVFQKIPVLARLSEVSVKAGPKENLFWGLRSRVKNSKHFNSSVFEVFLQKLLSKFRILTLKAENKTGNWLQRLREKSKKNKFGDNDNYWKNIRKLTKK
ncbi:MAG: hypothetical protein ABIG08_02155 [bacterium]